jgi:hypothetical protein
MGRRLLDGLDQDGAEPDHELDNQTNELHVIRSPDGLGGWIKGRLDSVTFDALVQVIEALIKPCGDEGKARPERQADALGEMCERLLDVGELPDAGGQAPHLTVVIEHEKLRKGLRGGSLTATGCRSDLGRSAGPPAPRTSSRLSSAARVNLSTSTGRSATRPATSARYWPSATVGALTPGAPPPRNGAPRTTSNTGSTVVTPISTIWSCSAERTTA